MTAISNGLWQNGWYRDAAIIQSPNFDDRPADQTIDTIVIHSISLPPGEYGGDFVECFFQNTLDSTQHCYFEEIKDLCVSSHFYIKRTGELIQFVCADKRAWHAGESCFDGRNRVNDFSIGIELEGLDTDGYSEEQYLKLASLTTAIIQAYPKIAPSRIVGHNEIAPQRKTDPGPWFNWDYYWDLIS